MYLDQEITSEDHATYVHHVSVRIARWHFLPPPVIY